MDGVSTAAVAVVAMTVLVVVTGVTGHSKALCERMGGAYTPENNVQGKDVCPGGKWSNIFRKRDADRR